ncbi:MAG TPA: polysaccharide biosynthesis/export family protein [Blastocatellia bacterium]|nr:polysaccharide biosynthesis/export family protein [Blastocatellia bacterium]
MTEHVLSLKPWRSLKSCALVLAASVLLAGAAFAQANTLRAADDKSAPQAASRVTLADDADPYFKTIYRDFYDHYKIGPADALAIRVVGQPEYSLEKVVVSPVGRVYHPLVGDVEVVGLTMTAATEKLRLALAEFIRDPRVSVALLEANSAKIGVIGDVNHPGIVLMGRPMTVLEAISAAGGVSDLGSKSNITLLRQLGDGTMRTFKVNLKRVMEAKASPEENPQLQAGDTLIVHGNFKKTLGTITSLAGFGSFVRIVAGQ